jgi:tripartite-type tricarboxylate transporter receptor subunit TctC
MRSLLGALALSLAALAHAQTWPSQPVKIIAPFPPGGPIDSLARLVGEKFRERTGQPVVVENRPGAAGNIGISAVARSAPDGYTWLFVPQGNITINPTLMKSMPFDWGRDFAPVTLIAQTANVVVVNPAVPVATIQELIKYAKANPGKLTYGSPGVGSSLHLVGEMLKREAGIDIVHVAYKGTTPAMQDLMGGQISMMFGSLPTLMPQVKAGKLRALAVTTVQRSPAAPELPTLIEAGLKGFDVPSWYGAMVPAATPPALVARIQAEIEAAVNAPDVRAKLEAQGMYPVANRPDAFAAQIKRETASWARVIRDGNIKVEE